MMQAVLRMHGPSALQARPACANGRTFKLRRRQLVVQARYGNSSPEVADRVIAAVPYLLPFLDAFSYGRCAWARMRQRRLGLVFLLLAAPTCTPQPRSGASLRFLFFQYPVVKAVVQPFGPLLGLYATVPFAG